MRRSIIYILLLITLVSCSTTKQIGERREAQSANYDSLFQILLQIEADRYQNNQIHTIDSVFTHVTIVRYDTIVRNGEPIVRERIDIDQSTIKDEQRVEVIHDTIVVTKIEEVKVSASDSSNTDQYTKRKSNKDLWTFVCFLVIVFLSYCSIQYYKRGK